MQVNYGVAACRHARSRCKSVQMSAVVVEVVAAQAHRCGGGDIATGDDHPGNRGERLEQLLDFGVVKRLERVVSRLAGHAGGVDVNAVSCESGLEGRVGTAAHCDVNGRGVRLRRTVEVAGVNGLMMNVNVVPLLTKSEVESSLRAELATQVGQHGRRQQDQLQLRAQVLIRARGELLGHSRGGLVDDRAHGALGGRLVAEPDGAGHLVV